VQEFPPVVSVCREAYQGDQVLARLLQKSGAAGDVAAVRAVLAGIAAAPTSAAPTSAGSDDWLRLVAADPGPALAAQLRALRDEIAAGMADPETRKAEGAAADRLERLRAELKRRGLAGFIVPRTDEHQGEYVPKRAQRLAWLTGFTGSAGAAIVLADRAAIFVDGRYTLQVRAQVDTGLYAPHHLTEEPPDRWLQAQARAGERIGYDPWLHTIDGVGRLRQACARAGAELVALPDNPIDAIWASRPPPPLAPVRAHDLAYAGTSAADKRHAIGAALKADGADVVVLNAPDSIAWLLNIRGGDVPRTPFALSFALLDAEGAVDLFIDRRKLLPGLIDHLGNGVAVRAPDELGSALDQLGAQGKRVRVDPAAAPSWIFDRLEQAKAAIVRAEDPVQLPKACKNAVELAGTRAAHLRDGAALTRFLAWLAREAPKGHLTEIDAGERLAATRAENAELRDLSFDSITGAGPNGAIVHYRATPETNRAIRPGELFLVDSGGQYPDGTTDVTRTVAIGAPGAEERDRFTRVLKGHIAIATARFPKGTSGSQLDTLARLPLWQAGLDYDHGTGHGVGSYLSVHEGPHRISKLPNTVALRPGMIVSNEPGYYKTGAYGIRIENLVTVVELPEAPGAERPMLGFETLTLAPIDRALVEPGLLTSDEIAWLDAYHARVRRELGPSLQGDARAWLDEATQPLGVA
jgi:Xaa-Pro aminopeptidase